jgi:hypothetical protein
MLEALIALALLWLLVLAFLGILVLVYWEVLR